MRVQTAHILAHVGLNGIGVVDGQVMIRIDGDENDAAVRVDRVLVDEADRQIVQDRRLVEIRQRRQIVLA